MGDAHWSTTVSAEAPSAVKHCSGCDRDLPADVEHFHKRAASKDGLQARCKDCAGDRDTEKARQQARAYGRAMSRLRTIFRERFESLYAEELEREKAS